MNINKGLLVADMKLSYMAPSKGLCEYREICGSDIGYYHRAYSVNV